MDLPTKIIQVLRSFEGVFSQRVWEWAKVLLIGAVLAPGERTVASILRVMGRSNDKQFQNYHRVLNRARWSSRAVSRILLVLLVDLFVPATAPIVVGIDETIERRRGGKIAARGIYRDPVRSSHEFFVKTSGLRWICLMLLTPIPWASRVWALPFLTVLAPSARYHEQQGKKHKTITDWARQMIRQLHRWLPERALVIVADGSYAVVEFLAHMVRLPHVTLVTRMRLDAALYDPAPIRAADKKGRPAVKGKRQPTLAKRLADPATVWQTSTVSWYGGVTRSVEMATGTALWYHAGVPPVPLRWVLIRDPEGKFAHAGPCCVPTNMPTRFRSWHGLSCVGRSKSPFMRCAPTWAWRRSANGRIWPFCAPRLPSWDSFRLSPFLLSSCWVSNPFRPVRLPGMPKPCLPFRIRWRSFVSICGPPAFLPGRLLSTRSSKFHGHSLTASWILSPIRRDLDKV